LFRNILARLREKQAGNFLRIRSDGFGGRENWKLEIRNVELGRCAAECALRLPASREFEMWNLECGIGALRGRVRAPLARFAGI